MTAFVLNRDERDLTTITFAVNELAAGRSNAVGIVTLAASTTVTTVPAINCAPGSRVFLFPTTANAAAAVPTTFVAVTNVTKGQFVVSHANAATTDRTFSFVALG